MSTIIASDYPEPGDHLVIVGQEQFFVRCDLCGWARIYDVLRISVALREHDCEVAERQALDR
jgi:hypothetical protein